MVTLKPNLSLSVYLPLLKTPYIMGLLRKVVHEGLSINDITFKIQRGLLDGLGDFCISLLGNHVLACGSLWGCKVGNIFAKIYSLMTNGSDALKI